MRKFYIIAVIAVVLGVVQLTRHNAARKRYEAEAQALYDRANELAKEGKYEAALTVLDGIHEKYSDSSVAASARDLRVDYAAKLEEQMARKREEEARRKEEEESLKARRDLQDPMSCCCREGLGYTMGTHKCLWVRRSECARMGKIVDLDEAKCAEADK
jgi:hypothetical protein